MHPSFSHDDMNKMFEAPHKFSIADLLSNSEVVEAAAQERRPSKPSLSEYYHVDESDFSSHRRFSFPHTHQPLRSMSSRLLKGTGSGAAASSSGSIEKVILEKKRKKKRKKKKKKKKVRSYPSRNAIQSPTIPEEEEDDDSDSSDSDMSEDGLDDQDGAMTGEGEGEESQFVGTASPTPEPAQLEPPTIREPTPDSIDTRPPSSEPLFFLGGEALVDPSTESEPEPSSEGQLSKVPSVAAQKFKRNVSEAPATSPMFSEMGGEEPRPSEHAAALHVLGQSGPNVSQPASRVGSDIGAVTFTIGDYASVPKMHESEPSTPLKATIPAKLALSDTGSPNHSPSSASPTHHRKPSIKSVSSSENTRSKHRHHHHRHEHFHPQDLSMRRQKGSEVHLHDYRKEPTEVEEAEQLIKSDLDQMSSHRFAELPGMRRAKITKRKGTLHSIVHIGKSHKEKRERPKKKHFDHSPHEVFVELDELHMGSDTELEWREKARWIKFEEDVEEGAERWGKPHVASLSFHSLLELRRGLEQGVLLLDLEASDLPAIVNAVVDRLIVNDMLYEADRGHLMRTLLLKHKHQHEKSLMKTFSHASFGSSMGLHRSNSHLNADDKDKKKESNHAKEEKGKAKIEMVKVDVDNNMAVGDGPSPAGNAMADHVIFRESFVHLTDNMTDGVHIGLVPLEQQKRHVQDIMRRIPAGSEVSTVLVGQVDYMRKPALAFVRLSEGQYLENLTEVPLPVRFVFVLLGPEKSGMDYHEVGRSISTLMSNQAFHDVAYQAESREELLQAINLFLDDSIVLPPGDWDQKTLLPIMDMARKRAGIRRKLKQKEALIEKGHADIPTDPLQRTKRIFGGFINDIKRRYPHYVSDFRDALNFKCLMATIFIFFACISPCIAFGGLLDEKTNGLMGVTETIVCTSVAGMLFSLLCGQPLMIIGPTGPVLVFEQSLYKFAKSYEVEFLPMRCWIGLYVAIISIVVVAFEGSFLVRYVTRFAEEIFAILISIIFIYDVVKKLVHTFEVHPLVADYCDYDNGTLANVSFINDSGNALSVTQPSNGSVFYSSEGGVIFRKGLLGHQYMNVKIRNQPNTALLSLILTIGTFLIAYFLRIFRNSRFLGRSVRRALGDFGVLIAILAMSLLDYIMKDTYTQKLVVDDVTRPTSPNLRGWLINPLGMDKALPVWVIFASIIPAVLIFILLFLEVQITEMILNKKERKLAKGCGFHLDQFIMGVLTFLCALFGLPWLCAATVRTMAHVSALSSYSKTHAPGEKPHLLGVKEQRLTNFIVHLFIGLSLTLGPVLRAIPVMALFGVFLYLGVSAMSGVQMFERIKLLLMPVKYHPSVGYVRRVRVLRMHFFTVIQLVLLLALLLIKSTAASLIFPFALMLLMPIRHKIMSRIFSPAELRELDKEEEDSEVEDEDDPDFYQMAHMPI
ncbi:band 3 anion transport protein-like isoform X2 [Littorina saxatilis]|uniref:band 3 anion transport protein-like isoform X2 n=1 Tax=Littorina saxatilis TaxID=31220 RepID=UPI0038B48D7C